MRSSSFLGNTGEDWDILGNTGNTVGDTGTYWEQREHCGKHRDILGVILGRTGTTWEHWECWVGIWVGWDGLWGYIEIHWDILGHTGSDTGGCWDKQGTLGTVWGTLRDTGAYYG